VEITWELRKFLSDHFWRKRPLILEGFWALEGPLHPKTGHFQELKPN